MRPKLPMALAASGGKKQAVAISQVDPITALAIERSVLCCMADDLARAGAQHSERSGRAHARAKCQASAINVAPQTAAADWAARPGRGRRARG